MSGNRPLRIAHPHRGLRIIGADREVLGHALHEPQRHAKRAVGSSRDVELERVHDLVPEHVVGVGKAGRKRQHDAPLACIGETPGALLDQPGVDIRLLEAAVRPIEHDGLTSGEGMVEHDRQPRVPPLRHPPGNRRGRSILV
jgi:hypothetical protein